MSSRTRIFSVGRGWEFLNDDGSRTKMRWYHHAAEWCAREFRWRWTDRHFRRFVQAAKAQSARFYGGIGTIHGTQHLHVEVDSKGKVVAVWFRCQPLPFEHVSVGAPRAAEMRRMYGEAAGGPALQGVIVKDPQQREEGVHRADADPGG